MWTNKEPNQGIETKASECDARGLNTRHYYSVWMSKDYGRLNHLLSNTNPTLAICNFTLLYFMASFHYIYIRPHIPLHSYILFVFIPLLTNTLTYTTAIYILHPSPQLLQLIHFTFHSISASLLTHFFHQILAFLHSTLHIFIVQLYPHYSS